MNKTSELANTTFAREDNLDPPPRQTLDGESTPGPPRLHEAKQELLQQFVERSRRWSIADPQVSVTRRRREIDPSTQGNHSRLPAGLTWAPGRPCDSDAAQLTLSRPGFNGQWQAPSAAAALAYRQDSGTSASDSTSERVSAASDTSNLHAVVKQPGEAALETAQSDCGLSTGVSQNDAQEHENSSPSKKMAQVAWSMNQTLSTLRQSPLSSPVKNAATLRSTLRSGPPGAPDSPIRALYSDDKQLQALDAQSEDAVLHQLFDWTNQVLQRLLTAAEGATRNARKELEAAVKELVQERELCAEVQKQAEAAQTGAQKADSDRAAVQAMLDKEQTRIAAMREDIGARRARLDELQTTYAAKREMIAQAQSQWTKRSASCSTQVALGPPGGVGASHSGEQPNSKLGGTLRRAMGELGTLFSPKGKSQGRSTPFKPDNSNNSGALQVQMLPCTTGYPQYPEDLQDQHHDPLESQGRILTAYNTERGAPLLTHGMEFPPEDAIHPGEMIVERLFLEQG